MFARALIAIAVSAFDLNYFIFLDLLFSVISENSFPLFAVPTCAYREPTVFCDGLPRTYLVSSMPGRY
jgi:hypothetical protein